MPGKQAKVVTPSMLKRMLRRVSRSSHPARDRAMILLSIKAGLRACEIAGLDWSIILDAQGRVSSTIHVRDVIAKKRGGRRIAVHPDLRRALERLAYTTEPAGPVIRSYRGGHLKANSVVNWFVALFKELVRNQSPLRVGVAVDVALRRLDRPMPREQLHVAQAAAGAVDVAGGDRDEAAPAGVR